MGGGYQKVVSPRRSRAVETACINHPLQQQHCGARHNNRSLDTITERVRKVVSTPNSPSKSQTTRATATTKSSSTANDSHPRRTGNSRVRSRPTATESHQSLHRSFSTTTTPSLTITASSSFSDDVSFLSFHHYDDEKGGGNKADSASQHLLFWRRRASECYSRYGIQHWETATAFLDLGLVHVRCEQYTAAKDFFRTALRVFEKLFGPNDLRVAKTLEALGMAQSRANSFSSCTVSSSASTSSSTSASNNPNKAGLLLGLQSYRKCFRIRYDVQGPTHIDTVETLNKIANNYMSLHMFSAAKNDYLEVLTLRTAILGEHHPSVAVAAKSLGMAHLQRQEHEQAKAYFLQAVNVFALAGLSNHPMADQLRQDCFDVFDDLKERVEI